MSNSGIISERGDVKAVGDMTDNKLLRGDGGKGIQDSEITVDDSDNMSLVNTISVVDAPTTRLNLGAQTQDADLDAIAALTVAGMGAKTGAGTWATRTITGTSNMITISDGDGVAGDPTVDVATNFEATGMHGWNGAIIESPVVTVTAAGGVITFSVEQSGGGDLTLVFSDGYSTFDSTPAATIPLTAGTDTVPVLSYVYILQSTKALTASIVSYPAAEHIPLATVFCQSAASLATDGAYKVHAWTDHVTRSSQQGHISDLNAWIRTQNASWASGVGQTFTITTNGGAADNVLLTTVAGVVLQLHDHAFPAMSGTPDVYTVNDSATAYNKVTDLNALLTDSTGASMSGKYFSLVIWGVVSEATGDCKLMVNLPSGSYNNSSGVSTDASKYANFTIPADFRGTGFLIAQWNLRHQAAASGTWTSIDEIDLRGLIPAIEAGGSTASPNEFTDDVFRVLDDVDNTKELAFQCSGITAATTRTLTIPDLNGTVITSGTPTTTKGDILVRTAADNVREPIGANDTVLTADSTQTSGLKWAAAAGGGGAFIPYNNLTIASVYNYTTIFTAVTNVNITHQRLYLFPIQLGADFTISELGVAVSTAVAGSLGRSGIYSMSTSTGALTLVVDFGTFATSSTGTQTASGSQALSTSTLYLCALVFDTNSGSLNIQGSSAPIPFWGLGTSAKTHMIKDSVDANAALAASYTWADLSAFTGAHILGQYK